MEKVVFSVWTIKRVVYVRRHVVATVKMKSRNLGSETVVPFDELLF